MSAESSKTQSLRSKEFIDKYFGGNVIDIGAGNDPVVNHAEVFDLIHGDAQEILTYSNKESQLNMNVEKGKYEISKKEILQKFTQQVGVSDFILDDGKFIFVRVFEVMEPHAKELRDTRGAAISDYQNYLELEWIRNLKATYPVVINQDALNALIK